MWRYFKGDFLIYAASKVALGISSFALLRILTGFMQPLEYGAYTLIFAIVTISSTVTNSYLTNSITRFLPQSLQANKRKLFEINIIQISLPTILVTVAASMLVLLATGMSGFVAVTPSSFLFASIASGLASCFQIYSAYCYSKRSRWKYSALTVLQIVLLLVSASAVPATGFDHVSAAMACLALSYLVPILLLGMPITFIRPSFWKHSKGVLAGFMLYGGPLVALNIAIQLNTYLDQFMLRAMGDLHAVGLYAANYVIADKVVYALSSVISLTVAPLIYREWANGKQDSSYAMIWKAVGLFVGISAPVLIGTLLFTDQIMSSLTAPEFSPGRVIVPYVMIAALLSGLSSIVNYVHTLQQRTLELAISYLLSIGVNLLCNLIFIPRFGILGCAYSTLISAIVLLIVLSIRADQMSGLFRNLLRPTRSTDA